MRIISGSRKGRKLIGFEGEHIRPTTDRVKESIFNLIMPYVPSARVLDLFGGSGALTFEALSRGAISAICVDSEPKSIQIIKKNNENLGFDDKITIIHNTALSYVKMANPVFDIIFLDPPYNKGLIEPVIKEIVRLNLLANDGIIVLESDDTDDHSEFDGLSIQKQRKYGRTYVTIYNKGDKT